MIDLVVKKNLYTLRKSKSRYIIGDNAFLVFNLLSLLGILIPAVKVGIFASIYIVILLVLNFDRYKAYLKNFFTIYIICCLLATFSYLTSKISIDVLLSGITYTFAPSFLFLIGAEQSQRRGIEKVVKSILYPSLFMMAFGLLFFTFFPDVYFERIGQGLDTHSWGLLDYRFGSYIDSLNLGSVCVASFAMIFMLLKSQKWYLSLFAFALTIICVLLTMERSAWVVSVFLLVLLFLFSKLRASTKIIIGFSALAVLTALYFFRYIIFSESQIDYILVRLSNVDFVKMTSERSGQWRNAIEIFKEFPFGYGIGSYGHKSIQYGYPGCADGNYFRILAESGLFGIISFLASLIYSLSRQLKKKNYVLVLLLLGFCLQALGTNVFDLYYSSFIFWFFLGFCHYYNGDKKYYA